MSAEVGAASVHSLQDIKRVLPGLDLFPALEQAFQAYSRGEADVPPVGELLFTDPPGDAHIKYGRMLKDDVFVIKVATGFYENPRRGLPGNSGLMLVFSSRTGLLDAVLLDEGHLTNVRTALAGAVAAKHLAPANVDCIAVLGTGTQARMQVEALAALQPTRRLHVWGRRTTAVEDYLRVMTRQGYDVCAFDSPAKACRDARLVITTTSAEQPILTRSDISHGTHITAMGSDTEAKNELAPELVAAADIYVADSISQCAIRGELHHAITAGLRTIDSVFELGAVVGGKCRGRQAANDISIADLTGVAVQDIAIAKAVCAALKNLELRS